MKRRSIILKGFLAIVISLALMVPFIPAVYAIDGLSRAQNPRLYDMLAFTHPELLEDHMSNFIPQSRLAALTGTLNLYGRPECAPLTSLAWIGRCTHITGLDVSNNALTTLSSTYGVSTMTGLTFLNFSDNRIHDLSPVSALTGLTVLYAENNRITDLTPLETLSSVVDLTIQNNFVNDLRPLTGKTSLHKLTIAWNLLNHEYPELYDNVISTLSGLNVDEPYDVGQLSFDIRYRPGPYGTCSAPDVLGVSFNHLFTLPDVTVTASGVTFLGWDVTGDGTVDRTAGQQIDVSPAVPFNRDVMVHEFDFPVNAVYATSHGKLQDLTYTEGKLDSAFSKDDRSYTLELGEDTADVTITPVKYFAEDIMRINGHKLENIQVHVLQGHTKTVTITVQSSLSRKVHTTYKVKVHRAFSSNANLDEIRIPPAIIVKLDPGADTAVLNTDKQKSSIKPIAHEKGARIWIGGKRCSSRTYVLKEGESRTILIMVQAPDKKTVKTYTVTLTRSAPV